LLLNMFHGGKLKAMPARLLSDDGLNTVIRPMAYAREQDIEEYAQLKGFPIIPCNLCGSQDNLQRQHIKAMLRDWEKNHPGRIESMTKSLQNVVPSHLMDTRLHNFKQTERLSNEQVCEEVDLALLNLPL
jgi:tRNA 2-thiocytidine biosynthesis protein TtcA